MMRIAQTSPSGQSMIELVVVMVAMSALLMMVLLLGVVGDVGIRTSLAARFAVFDCDVRPGNCAQTAEPTQSKIRSSVLTADRREILAVDQPSIKTMATLGRDAKFLSASSDLRLMIDLPRVDGAEKNLLAKLADAFRRFGMKAGPAIFDLPSPDQLTRATVRTTLWASQDAPRDRARMPPTEITSRIAMISDTWAAADRQDLTARVQAGQTPVAVAGAAIEALYIPGKDVLMPVLDLVGLESGTSQFRQGFHRVDHDTAYANSRITIR